MSQYPEPLAQLITEFKKLPSIGQRTAERLAFHMLNQSEDGCEALSQALLDLKSKIRLCKDCYNFAEEELCLICQDLQREREIICVISHPPELWKIEKSNGFRGLYHVLGGLISPVNDIHPEDLHIEALMRRLQGGTIKEVIFALDPKVEGEATSMYLARRIKTLGVSTSRIAQGVPIGREIEFADELTLNRALEGRVSI
jgi:recombination protein RecR